MVRFAGIPLDWPAGRLQPSVARVLVATIVALAASLAACRLLVIIGTALFPSTAGYQHFEFVDYAKLTTIGVVVSCVAWPIVTLATSQGRRLLLFLAILVTLGSLIPDLWILYKGQPAEAVVILALMHVALLGVTYPSLVFIAPQPRDSRAAESS
jgi:hypothetical protein